MSHWRHCLPGILISYCNDPHVFQLCSGSHFLHTSALKRNPHAPTHREEHAYEHMLAVWAMTAKASHAAVMLVYAGHCASFSCGLTEHLAARLHCRPVSAGLRRVCALSFERGFPLTSAGDCGFARLKQRERVWTSVALTRLRGGTASRKHHSSLVNVNWMRP